MKFKTFTALKHRNFRLFFIGQAVSITGTWMHSTAQGWLVLELTDSAFYLSLIHSLGYWPILFLSLLGGVVADRVPKRGLLVVTQALSMFLAFSLAVLVSTGAVQVWHVAAFALFLGIVNTFDIPGRQAFIVEMVGKEDLMNGIALNSSLFHGARIIGPAVAGIIIGMAGIEACFYVNAASYVAILLCLVMMRIDAPAEKRKSRPVFRELMDGLAYIRNSGNISSFIFMVSVSSLFAIPYIALLPIFARDVLGIGATGLGFMMGFAGAGALLGALLLASAGSVRKKGMTAFAAMALSTVSIIAFAFSRTPALSYGLLFFAGFGMITQLATVNTIIQAEVPDELRGRVMSFYTLMFLGLIPVGNLLIGGLAAKTGAPAAVSLGSAACLVSTSVLFARRKSLFSH